MDFLDRILWNKYQISQKSNERELRWYMWTDMMKLTGTFHEYANTPKNLCVMSPHHSCQWGSWLNKVVHHVPLHVRSRCVSSQKCTQQYQHTISHLNHLLSGCTKSFLYTKHCTVSKHISPIHRNSQITGLARIRPSHLVARDRGWVSWGIYPVSSRHPCT